MSYCKLEERNGWTFWCADHDNLENSTKQAASMKPMTVPLISIVDGARHVIGEAHVEEIGMDLDGHLTVKGVAYLDPEADIEIIAQIHPLSKLLLDTLEWADVKTENS